jgi:hypothetical protein
MYKYEVIVYWSEELRRAVIGERFNMNPLIQWSLENLFI